MFSVISTNSNALAVAFFVLSLTSFCDARFRRAAMSSMASSAAASTKSEVARAAATTNLAAAATSGCPVPATVNFTVTVAPMTAGSLSSTDSNPTTLQPLPSSSVVSATSVIFTPSATPLPPTTTATTVSSLPATSVGSSTSSGVLPSALPGSGYLTITSKCPFPVYCLLTSAQDTTELWKPFPTDGYNLTFSNYVMPNGTNFLVWLGFSKTQDSGYTNGHTQFGFTWEPAKHLVTYQLSEESTNGTDPFMLNGYNAWPMPNNTSYGFCNGLHCGAGEQPCKAAYQKGEIPTATADNLYGNKTSICPDYIHLNFQLCTDVWT